MSTFAESVTVITWNILHGTFTEEVLRSISIMIEEKKADVICLQEAQIEGKLNDFLAAQFPGWRAFHIHPTPPFDGHHLAILWNAERLTLTEDPRAILLPILREGSLLAYQYGQKGVHPTQRAAMAATFLAGGREIRVTNLHASFEGGYFHRRRQIVFLAEFLKQHPAEREVVCGDFNTTSYGPLIWRFQQRTIQKILGPEFINAAPDISSTFDLQTIDSHNSTAFLIHVPLWMRKLFRSRMDYIFGRNMGKASGELLDLAGSDHRPLLGRFD